MKTMYLVLILCCRIAENPGVMAQTAEKNFNKLKWIEGTWIRSNNKAGQSGQERWVESSPYELKGHSFTMKGADTLFVERINIRVMNDELYYVADVPENNKPIYFKLTEVTEAGFVCENPAHDFPKKITYEYKDKILKASISGDGKAIDYYFKHQ
ncbi:MAG: hypothetical protein C0490_00385 [Marivirga sp.]|nr:hypothetical protein [Marivirga sp.]